jgi:prevent-host-death family protein
MKPTDKHVPAGHFKATCLKLMDEVSKKHTRFTITKHGKAVAMLVPVEDKPVNFFGCLKDTVAINNDLLKPIDVEWEANE